MAYKTDGFTRRNFMGITGAAALGAALQTESVAVADVAPAISACGESTGSRQNLILFMPDELRADALACYGNPLTRTPNFDRLAREGTQFNNCHVQYPICGPSRCSLLTGWPTSVRGHRSNSYFLRPDEPNMFRYLRQAGYDVFWYGKNDALAADCFFDSVTEWNYSAGKNIAPVNDAAGQSFAPEAPSTFIGTAGPDRRKTREYELILAATRILERKQSDKPFCIFLPLASPHPPYAAPLDFHTMYRPSDITDLAPIGVKGKPDYHSAIRKAYALDGLPEETFRQIRALYYGMVSYSDWLMGELLEALERTNHSRDTALMLLADHGDYAGDYGLVEKWPSGLEDQLTHVPLVVRVPGQTGGNKVDDPVMLFDTMATCLELAQKKAEHSHFARSLMPYLRGGKAQARYATFSEGGYNTFEPQCFEPPAPGLYHARLSLQIEQPQTVSRAACVRTKNHKLVVRPKGQSELYAYRDDPHELRNRFDDPNLADVQSKLKDELVNWYITTTGVAPYDKDQRDPPPFRPSATFPHQG